MRCKPGRGEEEEEEGGREEEEAEEEKQGGGREDMERGMHLFLPLLLRHQ